MKYFEDLKRANEKQKMWPSVNDVPWLMLSLMGFFVTVGALWFRWDDVKGAHLMKLSQYSTISGVVTQSRLYNGTSHRGGRNGSVCYEITYQYQVKGVVYTDKKVNFLVMRCWHDGTEQRYLQKYPTGRAIVVYYDPRNPSFSVLEPTVASNWLDEIAAVVIFGIASLIFWRSKLLSKRRELLQTQQGNGKRLR